MLPYNWRKAFDQFPIKVMRLLKLCTEGAPTPADSNPLHIIMASEYMFRKNPMGAISDINKSHFMPNDDSPTKSSNPVNFFNQSYKHTMYSAAEKDELIRKLCAATAGKNIMVVAGSIMWAESEPVMGTIIKSNVKSKGEALNSTYVVHNGTMVYNYNKHTDVSEIDAFEQKLFTFKPGSEGGTFIADGLSFGIEICRDHGGVRNHFEDTGTTSGIDIHMLVSDGNTFNAPAMRKGGFGLHCDRSKGEAWAADDSYAGRKRLPATGDLTWTLTLN